MTLARLPKLPSRLRGKVLTRVEAWLERLEPHTRRSYLRGLAQLGWWLAHPEQGVVSLPVGAAQEEAVAAAGRYLLALDGPQATLVIEAWLHDLLYTKTGVRYTRSTASSRLAAVRWALREARRLGQVTWVLDAQLPAARKARSGRLDEKMGRDMRGPTVAQAAKILARAKKSPDPRVWLLLSMVRYEGFREHEIRQIDREDLDMERAVVKIVRKKKDGPREYPLSASTMEAMRHWLEARGDAPGPLVFGGRRGKTPIRIGDKTIYRIVRRNCAGAGVPKMSPHRVRHRACTDIVRVATAERLPEEDILFLTGHSSRAALQPYYDATQDRREARAVLDLVSELREDA